MVGAYRVVIQNKKIKFDFEIRRNITILRGDSATGKTTLVEMIREYEELGPDSGIELQCEKDCVVLSGRQWKKQLADLSQSIVFIDEGNAFTASKEFAAAIQKTDNYYVLVTREGLETLPYSVTEIYGIRTSKHFGDYRLSDVPACTVGAIQTNLNSFERVNSQRDQVAHVTVTACHIVHSAADMLTVGKGQLRPVLIEHMEFAVNVILD